MKVELKIEKFNTLDLLLGIIFILSILNGINGDEVVWGFINTLKWIMDKKLILR